ncbi:MAG: ABC transporter ATP-binding protein [Bacilli bacterium]|nr:ABC transporter ATP-binding protein [Bacilli bacterium]
MENSEVLVELVDVTKNFGSTKVLKGINLQIKSNEFVTLLGPSGCGKTTTLRIIGGFEYPTTGKVIFEGKDITDLPPYQRSTNTVFQSYALFPHMDVFDNIAFGLYIDKKAVSLPYPETDLTFFEKLKAKRFNAKLEKYNNQTREPASIKDMEAKARKIVQEKHSSLSQAKQEELYYSILTSIKEEEKKWVESKPARPFTKAEIKTKVESVIKLVNLTGMEHRNVSHLSGGQRQRVAIARAIVLRPKMLLLDESLSALDLKLRKEMQYELKELQKSTGITFVFVTHDQEEALTMSDKIVVMKDGYIEQIGTAEEIYNEPVNRYVANFIGDSNIIKGEIVDPKHVKFAGKTFLVPNIKFAVDQTVDVMLRPEDLDIVYPSKGKLLGVVDSIFFKGVFYEVDVRLSEGSIVTIHTTDYIPVGKDVGISFDTEDITLMEEME